MPAKPSGSLSSPRSSVLEWASSVNAPYHGGRIPICRAGTGSPYRDRAAQQPRNGLLALTRELSQECEVVVGQPEIHLPSPVSPLTDQQSIGGQQLNLTGCGFPHHCEPWVSDLALRGGSNNGIVPPPGGVNAH